MSIITISRGSYSRGKEVAEKLAQRLGYDCISRDILLEASNEFNMALKKKFNKTTLTLFTISGSSNRRNPFLTGFLILNTPISAKMKVPE